MTVYLYFLMFICLLNVEYFTLFNEVKMRDYEKRNSYYLN